MWFKKKEPVKETYTQEQTANIVYNLIRNYDRKLPMRTPNMLKEYVSSHKIEVCEYILSCLETAIIKQDKEITLFRLGESKMIAKILEEDYESSIQGLDKIFLKIEHYETVQKCRDLIKQLYINRLIKESSFNDKSR